MFSQDVCVLLSQQKARLRNVCTLAVLLHTVGDSILVENL